MAIRLRLAEIVEHIRDSYWLVPGVMALAGFVAGLVLVLLDATLGDGWLGHFEWFYGSRPEGARAVLSTIASSTITVAGVVFSVTLAAVTYASGQHGPRLLSNFQRDRGNQVTLGTFIATFLYCLVVLRTIRSAEEASADTAGAVREAFVPQAALYGAIGLAIASIGVLIYFVHHVTDSIHINNVIARIGRSLIEEVRSWPRREGETPEPPRLREDESTIALRAPETGYIEAIDHGALVELATRHDLQLTLLNRPGDFVHEGRPLIRAAPAGHIDPDVADDCDNAFAIGRRRTPLQDLRFLIDELVEIAARALSPGVNDPFTAISCIDWLGATLSELDRAAPRQAMQCDDAGTLRLVTLPIDFATYVETAFGQLRPYAARDPNARRHALATLQTVADDVSSPASRAALLAEHARLAAATTD